MLSVYTDFYNNWEYMVLAGAVFYVIFEKFSKNNLTDNQSEFSKYSLTKKTITIISIVGACYSIYHTHQNNKESKNKADHEFNARLQAESATRSKVDSVKAISLVAISAAKNKFKYDSIEFVRVRDTLKVLTLKNQQILHHTSKQINRLEKFEFEQMHLLDTSNFMIQFALSMELDFFHDRIDSYLSERDINKFSGKDIYKNVDSSALEDWIDLHQFVDSSLSTAHIYIGGEVKDNLLLNTVHLQANLKNSINDVFKGKEIIEYDSSRINFTIKVKPTIHRIEIGSYKKLLGKHIFFLIEGIDNEAQYSMIQYYKLRMHNIRFIFMDKPFGYYFNGDIQKNFMELDSKNRYIIGTTGNKILDPRKL